ncbi:MAG: alpha/beta hydrolase [Gemmatimonadaceae bacterium]|nr:alpha/beta hydrolase [Gemmatimonadaceae bacterium]
MPSILETLRVRERAGTAGADAPVVVLANGFCTTTASWDAVAATIPAAWRVIRFDYAGSAGTPPDAWIPGRHTTLAGHAADVVAMLRALDVREVVFVGHSMSAMIGGLVWKTAPDLVARLVMLGASPRYIDDVGYWGGFTALQIEALVEAASIDLERWIAGFAPIALGEHATRAHLDHFIGNLLEMRPDIALDMVRLVFQLDMRALIPQITCPVDLLQSHFDAAVPPIVGVWLQKRLPQATLDVLPVNGHVPQMTHPGVVAERLSAILGRQLAAKR